MKKILYMLLVISMLALPASVDAHTLKYDGSIGVTMHVDPNDEPVAGSQTQATITIQDRNGQLGSDDHCACQVIVSKDNKPIQTTDFTLSNNQATVPIAFSDPGTYKVGVIGTPPSGSSFQRFSVAFTYNVTAAKGSNQQLGTPTSTNELDTYMPFVVVGTACFIVILFSIPSHKKPPRPRKA